MNELVMQIVPDASRAALQKRLKIEESNIKSARRDVAEAAKALWDKSRSGGTLLEMEDASDRVRSRLAHLRENLLEADRTRKQMGMVYRGGQWHDPNAEGMS